MAAGTAAAGALIRPRTTPSGCSGRGRTGSAFSTPRPRPKPSGCSWTRCPTSSVRRTSECPSWGNQVAYQRNFTCIFPTKFERNRWAAALKHKLTIVHSKQAATEGTSLKPSQAVRLNPQEAQRLLREPDPHPPRTPITLTLTDSDAANDRVRNTLNLASVNKRFIEHKKKIYETSTRKIMSLNELRNLPDVESSKTFVTVKYSEEVDDEKIICFLDDSKDEAAKPPTKASTKPSATHKRK